MVQDFKIVVCLKVIRQLSSDRGFDAVTKVVNAESLVTMLNPEDEYALEMALLLKEKIGHAEIIAISLSPVEDEVVLRRYLAMGVDHAFRIWDEGFDTLNAQAVAFLLSESIRRIEPDLIFCGKKALDTNGNETGGYLAEFLNVPQVSGVTSVDISQKERGLICRRQVNGLGWELVETSLPVLLSVEIGDNEPRYPNLFSILVWLEKEIKTFDKVSLKIDNNRLDEWNSMVRFLDWNRPKPEKIFTPKGELPPEERMQLIVSGGMDKKKTEFIEGEIKVVASQVVDLLARKKLLKTHGEV